MATKYQDFRLMKTNEKNTQQGVVPALRFPEFQKCENWDVTRLKQISTRITTKVGDSQLQPISISAGIGFVAQTEKFGRDISGEQYHNYIELNKGEFAYNKGNSKKYPQGCVYRLEEFDKVAAPNAFLCFRFNDNVIPDFFKGYFDSNYHGKQLQNIITSGARSNGLLNIGADDFFNIILPIPKDKAEQQKIAECLASIDALIKAAENKIDELKNHKKGLMRQLFPAEGKTVPALRFPEFQNAGEWSNSLLDKYIEEFQKKSFIQDEFEVLTSSREGLIRQREYYNNDRITERDNIGFNIIPPGYLTYRSRSDDRKFYFNENNLGIAGIISTYYPVFRIINGYGKFFIELLSYYAEIIGKYSDGTSQTVLSLNRLKSIKLPIPSKSEQQKIADCLSSLDDLITAQTNRLEALRNHKKGLMQQLFPNVNNREE